MDTINAAEFVDDLRNVVAETEHLLRATAGSANEKVAEVRARVEHSLHAARKRLQNADRHMAGQVRLAARTADRYVHDHPWNAIGVAAGIAFALGCLAARR